ncbi:MAG: nuclear transport factor 2 family protein [Leptospira sp.]|nr:nuclear transport factor 2 family protein [Leptospira sp.]
MKQKPNFDHALQDFLNSISNRNIETYKKYITNEKEMYTIVQNGHAFITSLELISIHEEWFKDLKWIWEGKIVRKVVGEDMSFALIKYDYQITKEDPPFSNWLTYVFRLENNEWRVIHDHNTALDFKAFAKSAGIDI